jgi:56kDa selenium binding protein (SBP56)
MFVSDAVFGHLPSNSEVARGAPTCSFSSKPICWLGRVDRPAFLGPTTQDCDALSVEGRRNLIVAAHRQDELPLRDLGRYALILTVFGGEREGKPMHHSHEGHHKNHASCGPGYPSPKEAMEKAEREKVLYTMALYVGTDVVEPDHLATVDVGPESSTYSQEIHRTPMPNVGDELHHFGWNACSFCYGDESKSRRFLIVPGQRSSWIHVSDTADERAPKIDGDTEQGRSTRSSSLTSGRSPLVRLGRTRCATRGATSPRTSGSEADDPFEGKPSGSWWPPVSIGRGKGERCRREQVGVAA